MAPDVLKAIAIGICASAPIGPAAILVLQKSLSYGPKAGFTTGLGVTTADTTYATLSVFALAATQNFIDRHEYLIYLIGGLIVSLFGASIAFKDPFRKMKDVGEERGPSIKDFFQAFLTALSNPGAVAVMMALFAFFKVDVGPDSNGVLPVLLGVAFGSVMYWYVFSLIIGKARRAINFKWMVWVSRVAGIIVMILGITLVGEGACRLIWGRG